MNKVSEDAGPMLGERERRCLSFQDVADAFSKDTAASMLLAVPAGPTPGTLATIITKRH